MWASYLTTHILPVLIVYQSPSPHAILQELSPCYVLDFGNQSITRLVTPTSFQISQKNVAAGLVFPKHYVHAKTCKVITDDTYKILFRYNALSSEEPIGIQSSPGPSLW